MKPAWTKLSVAERSAAFDRITDPASPDYLPFYAREENVRRWDVTKKVLDGFGTHLICPLAACRRAGRCGVEDRRDLPFCFYHYRGIIRFAVMAELEGRGHTGGGAPGSPDDHDDEPDEPWAPRSRVCRSLLEQIRDRGVDIDALRRPVSAGRDPTCHEYEEGSRKAYEQLVAMVRARERRTSP